jgi:hypothetical protein
MDIFYTLNILTAVIVTLWPVWFSRRLLHLPLVNPFTITMVIGLPVQLFKLFGGPMVLIDEGLADTGYQFALLMSNVQVIAQTLGLIGFYWFFSRTRAERYLPMQRLTLGRADLRSAEYCFLALFLASFLMLTMSDFGLVAWLANPRAGYQLHRSGQGQWYALATSFLGVAFLLSFLGRPKPRNVLKNTLFYLALSYFLGSKGIMLSIFTASVIFLWFIRWKHLGRLLFLGTPVVILLLLVNLFLALSDGFGLQAILEYFDYFKNGSDYYHAYFAGQIDLFYGQIFWSNLWAYVPRGFWPEKPFVYGVLLVNEFFFPGQAELTNTPAFGGAVEQFADFGVAGVVVFGLFSVQSIITACFSYFTFRRPGIRFDQVTMATVFLMVVQFAPMFGSFFPGALYVGLLGFVLAVVRLCRRSRSRSRSAKPADGFGQLAAPGSGGAKVRG